MFDGKKNSRQVVNHGFRWITIMDKVVLNVLQ